MIYEYKKVIESESLEQECSIMGLDGWRIIHIDSTSNRRSATLEREARDQIVQIPELLKPIEVIENIKEYICITQKPKLKTTKPKKKSSICDLNLKNLSKY